MRRKICTEELPATCMSCRRAIVPGEMYFNGSSYTECERCHCGLSPLKPPPPRQRKNDPDEICSCGESEEYRPKVRGRDHRENRYDTKNL